MTLRLVLREHETSDAEAVTQFATDSDVFLHTNWGPLRPDEIPSWTERMRALGSVDPQEND